MAENIFAKREEEILAFWEKEKIFEKSLAKESPKGGYVFYDGPPFATGTPHYGHFPSLFMKDMVPRYWTMRGYRVERRWGWDCHGLPIENIIEKELHVKSKQDIEAMGVETFNAACRAGVLKYVDVWKKFIPRIGRWADMDHPYTTMDTTYTESIWWAFKQLHEKKLVYEGKKSMHICPRCGTPLSNFEVTQGYKDVTDQSVIVKFQLQDDPHTFFLAWTTTPWTLPGNVALAVKEDVAYVKAMIGDETYILAAERADELLPKGYEVVETIQGKDLVGQKYVSLFPYFTQPHTYNLSPHNLENGWQVVSDKGVDFITFDEGTGIVHMAPAFGEDDMRMGEMHHLPFIQHVDQNGRFLDAVTEWAGELVKPKGDPQQTDKKIVAWLKEHGRIFSASEVRHSYPHCWRCDTPLLNYATSSWFVRVTELKERMMEHNKTIRWVPEHVRDGRFGKWLEGARDWAVSRLRYWGAPLPVWKCQTGDLKSRISNPASTGCGNMFVAGAITDIPWPTKLKNTYWLVRHGECTHNIDGLAAPDERELELPQPLSVLTAKGKEQIKALGASLQGKGIDVIESSDLYRTRETAEGIAVALHLSVRYNPLLREIREGDNNMRSLAEIRKTQKPEDRFEHGAPGGGESLDALRERMLQAFHDIESRYEGKTIAIVSHGDPLWVLEAAVQGTWGKELFSSFYPMPGSAHRLYDIPVDLHRPTIDQITLPCTECGGTMRRIPDVFDCWFESGSMPYAGQHYPFEHEEEFEKNFPAEFIAEGMDQTRGWFYTLLVLSTALFDKPPFRQVIVNGIVLAEDGQKMSKRLKNYPDPTDVLEKYGADALRYYLLSSPVVEGENIRFEEKGVQEVYKKIILILHNALRFYEMFEKTKKHPPSPKASGGRDKNTKAQKHVLDRWIIARLNQMTEEVTEAMDVYNLPRATRPIGEFINDLSTWYIRRSRERLKHQHDTEACLATLRDVFLTLSKIMAPCMPFIAEHIYQSVSGYDFKEGTKSVHLEEWPISTKTIEEMGMAQKHKSTKTIEEMEAVRKIVEMGHAAREEAGMKVRQPLADFRFKILDLKLTDEHTALLRDELNVKHVQQEEDIQKREGWIVKEGKDMVVALHTALTPALEAEGVAREFSRQVNALRKKRGLTPSDSIGIVYGQTTQTILDAIEEHKGAITSQTIAKKITYDPALTSKNSFSIEKQNIPIEISKI